MIPQRSAVPSGHACAAALLALAAALSGCKLKTNTYSAPPAPEVTVAHPVRKQVTQYLEYTGPTEAYESVELRARVPGFLDQVNFKAGSKVKKGDLLFVIDPRVYQADVDQAEADLASHEASLQLAETTLARIKEAAAESAVSRIENDRALAERDRATAQVALSRAALGRAKLNLEFTQVRSPIDGRITRNFVDVGNLVGEGGQATMLATVVNSSPLYVNLDVSESDTLAVRRARMATQPGAEPGQRAPGEWRPALLATQDSDRFDTRGQIDYVDPALNPRAGTIRVRCRFENEDGLLLPGLFVRVRVLLQEAEETLVPDIALLTDQSGRYALVVDEKEMVEVRRVKIGAQDGAMRVVLEGLTPADRVIVNGFQRARPGVTVKATEKAG